MSLVVQSYLLTPDCIIINVINAAAVSSNDVTYATFALDGGWRFRRGGEVV